MRHTTEVVIDELQYSITHYPATLGWRNHTKLLKYLGAPLGVGLMGDGEGLGDVPVDKLLGGLLQNIADPEVEKLIKDLLQGVTYDGNDLSGSYFDIHFRGRIGHLYKLLFEVVRFNFADFLDVIAHAVQQALAKGGLNLQKTSAGPSGGSSSRAKRSSGK